jgi:hypothetical protein
LTSFLIFRIVSSGTSYCKFPDFAVGFHFHQQEQIAFQTFFQSLVLADEFFVNETVFSDGYVRKIMGEKFPCE